MKRLAILAAGLFSVSAGAQMKQCPVTVKVPGYVIQGLIAGNMTCDEANKLFARALPLPPGQSVPGYKCSQQGTSATSGAVGCQATDTSKKAILGSWKLPDAH